MSAPFLVDTHILIWSRTTPDELKEIERSHLIDAEQRFISIATFWELGTLARLGKVKPDVDWFSLPDGFDTLEIGVDHCRAMATLPLHHRDPFDRMLIAQARTEGLGLLTRDKNMLRYGRMRDGLLIPD
jgi:PIN domain nuclease of toxin-antitoxin system